MSLANSGNATNQANLDIFCNTLTCTTLDASFSTFGVIDATNITTEGLQIQPNPPVNNTLNNLLALDSVGDVVIREATSIPGAGNVSGGASLGSGSPIYQSETAFVLQFNSLTGTSGDIVVAAPSAGNVNIDVGTNIAKLASAQQFTGSNQFLENGSSVLFQITQSSAPFPSLIISPGGSAAITTLTTSSTVSSQVITLPDATDTLLGRSTIDTISNKTLDSASNTLTITSSPLTGLNINALINQDIRTSASPTFANLTSSGTTTTTQLYGHAASIPTIVVGAGTGVGGTASISGNDLCGTITIVTGASPPTGPNTLATVTMSTASTTIPLPILSMVSVSPAPASFITARPIGAIAASNQTWNVTNTFGSAVIGSTTYVFYYFVPSS